MPTYCASKSTGQRDCRGESQRSARQAILRVLAMTWSKLSCAPPCSHQRFSQWWHEAKCTREPSVSVIAIDVTRSLPQIRHLVRLRASTFTSEAGPLSSVDAWREVRRLVAVFGTGAPTASSTAMKVGDRSRSYDVAVLDHPSGPLRDRAEWVTYALSA